MDKDNEIKDFLPEFKSYTEVVMPSGEKIKIFKAGSYSGKTLKPGGK